MMREYCFNGFMLLMCLSILVGCDPAYEYFIEANNDDVVVEIQPSLESIYCPDLKEVCDFATSHKIKEGTYQIKSGDKFSVYGGVGTQASVNSFPFDFVKIIQGGDTLLLKGKEQILKKFVRDKTSNKYYLRL